MSGQGVWRPDATPPPRTAETEHLYDRGVPQARTKAEKRLGKYTVYGQPVKPSRETPREFWGERLPYFKSHELHRVDAMLNGRPKKKRKPKNQRQEIALAMDGTDITKEIEAGKPTGLELPVEQAERSRASGPTPGFLHRQGTKRKRKEQPADEVLDQALPDEHDEAYREDVATGRAVDADEAPEQPDVDTERSTDQLEQEMEAQPVETGMGQDMTADELNVDAAIIAAGVTAVHGDVGTEGQPLNDAASVSRTPEPRQEIG